MQAAICASLLFLNWVVFACCDLQYGIDSRIPVPVPLRASVGCPRSLYPRGHFSQNYAYHYFTAVFIHIFIYIYNLYDQVEPVGFPTSSTMGRMLPSSHIGMCWLQPMLSSNRERGRERGGGEGCLKQKVPVLTFFFCLLNFYFIACASFGTGYVAPICLYRSSSIITILLHCMVLLNRACGIKGAQTTRKLTVLRLHWLVKSPYVSYGRDGLEFLGVVRALD